MHRCVFVSALVTLASAWSSPLFAQGAADPTTADPAKVTDTDVVIDSAPGQNAAADGGRSATPTPVVTGEHAAPAALAPSPSVASTPSVLATPPSVSTASALATPPSAASAPTTSRSSKSEHSDSPAVELGGYAQLQYESHQDSEDQLRQGGSLYNQDRVLVRRIRLEASRRYGFAGYLIELDANTSSGPAIGIHRAEGSVYYAQSGQQQPLLEFTAGLLKLPFGYETPESSKSRWFMERTAASRAFFPTEVDVGIRLQGAWRFLRYGVALANGEPKGTKATSFQLQDPNHAKDVTLRVGADVPVSDALRVSGGFSYLSGKGFHAGDSGTTKSSVSWSDNNEDGKIDINTGELRANAGQIAERSQNFRRWALGADLQARLRTGLGWSTLSVEAVAAMNLDRGLFVADPVLTGLDARELGWYIGFTQELSPYALVGFRYDSYNPDSDLLDSRGGRLIPKDQTIATYSPVVGLALPNRARLVFQYDIVHDKLARDASGVPTDLSNNLWTLRLQVNL